MPWDARLKPWLERHPALGAIGNTPLVPVDLFRDELPRVEVLAKLESLNPGGSLKDRPVLRMLLAALTDGRLEPGKTVLDSSSGNAGIAYAMIGGLLGLPVEIVIPDNASVERKRRLLAHGARLHFTDAVLGYDEALREVHRRHQAEPDRYFFCDQYGNDDNWRAHYETTAAEILEQCGGRLTHVVAGVGTGGTVTGVGEGLREKVPGGRIVAVEPARSPVLSGGKFGIHAIQGIGASFVPGILNRAVIDEIVLVRDEDAASTTLRLTREEGLLVGVSAGANVWAALGVAERLGRDRVVVTVLPDTGERYLSMNLDGKGA